MYTDTEAEADADTACVPCKRATQQATRRARALKNQQDVAATYDRIDRFSANVLQHWPTEPITGAELLDSVFRPELSSIPLSEGSRAVLSTALLALNGDNFPSVFSVRQILRRMSDTCYHGLHIHQLGSDSLRSPWTVERNPLELDEVDVQGLWMQQSHGGYSWRISDDAGYVLLAHLAIVASAPAGAVLSQRATLIVEAGHAEYASGRLYITDAGRSYITAARLEGNTQ
jgi:hypothetical protein